MRTAVSHFVVAIALCFWTSPAFAQADDADKKTIKRILPDLELVPSLYAKREDPVPFKALPKFSATKLFGYPINKKETVEAERGFWKASKDIYAKNHPLRAAIFEAMDETEKLKALELPMTIPGPLLTPKDRGDFQKTQKPIALAIFKLQQVYQQMQAAAEKRDQENNKRWQANLDLALTRMQGNLIFLFEYDFTLGQVRADNLPDLGKDDVGWKVAYLSKINTPEARPYAKDRVKLLRKIQEEHAGTPWAYFAERDGQRDLGMTWVAKKK